MSKLRFIGASGILAGEADFQEKCGSGGLSFVSPRGIPVGFSLSGKEKKEEYGIYFVHINVNNVIHVQKIALMK